MGTELTLCQTPWVERRLEVPALDSWGAWAALGLAEGLAEVVAAVAAETEARLSQAAGQWADAGLE